MLVPLTAIDTTCEFTQLCMCYVFSLQPGFTQTQTAEAIDRLKEATQRVVAKWPLLQGLPKKQKDKTWVIDVPDESAARPTFFGWTTKTVFVPYHQAAGLSSPAPAFNARASGALPRPKRSLFRPSGVANSFAEHGKKRLPLLHVHVTTCTDALVVGLSMPHGAMDGTGFGLVMRAITAELHQKDWIAPPLFEGANPWQQTLDALVDDDSVSAASDEKGLSGRSSGEGEMPPAVGIWRKFTLWPSARLLSSMCVERVVFKNERGWISLKQATVDALVKRVKAQVKEETAGTEFVSTGDIVFAFVFKAIHSREAASSAGLAVGAVYRTVPLLATQVRSDGSKPRELPLYPHNAIAPYLLIAPLSLSEVAQLPLSTLALHMRRNLLGTKTLPQLRTCWPEIRNGGSLPHRDWPSLFGTNVVRKLCSDGPGTTRASKTRGKFVNYWGASNQMGLGMAGLAIPTTEGGAEDLPLLSFNLDWIEPIEVDRLLMLTDTAIGVTVGGSMRRSRWKALRAKVDELERELATV
ncbi:uncharacterized protein JCM10292_001810 [Rhodotorula paludigena]|uniref:uncharacterized protein n=1 Tax=Rhodotorula paludigena TaxID=86838 RepID=UPI00316D6B6B